MSNELITVTVVGSETNATVTSGAEVVVTIGDVGPVTWSAVTGKPTTFPPQAHSHAIGDVTGLAAALAQKVELDPYGKVQSSQLPSFVDDVLEFANAAALPGTGESGKIYVTIDNGKVFRWSGSQYIEISAAPGSTDFVPEGTGNLYHTTARAAAAAPVQSVAGRTGAVALEKGDVGLGSVDNTADAAKPVSTAQAAADTAVASAAAADATSKANAAQAAAVQRANHTGTQAISTVTGLQAALDGKVGTSDARLSDARTPTDGSVTDAKIASGGLSESSINWAAIGNWQPNTAYAKGDFVQVNGVAYRKGTAGTSGAAWGLSEISLGQWIAVSPAQMPASIISSGTLADARLSANVVLTGDARLTDARTPTDGSVTDAKIATAGLSAASINWVNIQPWAANTAYAKGDLVSFQGIAYRRSVAGTSGATFNTANWQQITPSEFVASQIASGTLATARLGSGTANNTTFLRGDQSYAPASETFLFTRSSAPASASGSNGSYTWTIPSTAKAITVDCVGGGGGGGSGRRGAAGTVRGGGGGGGAAGRTIFTFPLSELSSFGLTISVAAGGAGGAARTADNTDGAAGTTGGSTSVSVTADSSAVLATAREGTPGSGGTTAGGGGGSTSWTSTINGTNGGAGGAGAAGSNAAFPVGAAVGGGGGGGVSAADAAFAGGGSFSRQVMRGSGTAATVSGGAVGAAGANSPAPAPGGEGGGGGGGGASTTAAAGAGGNGAAYGGGGGGGGASVNGFSSGAGGNGGDGVVRITVWY